MKLAARELAAPPFPGSTNRARPALAALALAVAAGVLALAARGAPVPLPSAPSGPASEAAAERAYGELPLAFEPNAGRTASQVDYIARAGGATHFLGANQATIALPGGAVRIGLAGSTPGEPEALERLPGVVNSLVGERSRWRTGIPTFGRVRYAQVWPGIDVEWYGNHRRLEYDFTVAPGADPGRIALRFSGQDSIRMSAAGDLIVRLEGRTVRQPAPIAYQASPAGREPVRAGYVLEGATARLRLGPYDRSRPLVIDPLIYLAIIDGPTEGAGSLTENPIHDVVVNPPGNAFIVGGVATSVPTTPGAIDTTPNGNAGEEFSRDAFVTKLNPSGSAAVYSTYLGGSDVERGTGIAIDADGEAFVTGRTGSSDFPTTAGLDQTLGGASDAFVTRLNASGSGFVWSSFVGGGGFDGAGGIDTESDGDNLAIVGTTNSTNWPTSESANIGICDFQEADPDGSTQADAYFTSFDATGALTCSTYLGGDGSDSATDIDHAGSVVVNSGVVGNTTSTDFPATGGALQTTSQGGGDAWVLANRFGGFISYLGGDGSDSASGVAVDGNDLYVTGSTASNVDGGGGDFPLTSGAFQDADPDPDESDGYVTTFIAEDELGYSTLLGGSEPDQGDGIEVDSNGAAHVGGSTNSINFPTTPRAIDTTPSGTGDAFVTKLNPAGSALSYSTYLSGGGTDNANAIALGPGGSVFVAGDTTQGLGQPVTPGTYDAPAGSFLAKLTPVPGPDVKCQGRSATLFGTNGADVLPGTNGLDVFAGLGGGDTIVGIAGNDLACGGAGNDKADGGPGRDRLNGEAGKDQLKGGGGRDVLNGGGGRDVIKGGAGRDILKGGGGRDLCIGGKGRDRARGCERKRSIRR